MIPMPTKYIYVIMIPKIILIQNGYFNLYGENIIRGKFL